LLFLWIFYMHLHMHMQDTVGWNGIWYSASSCSFEKAHYMKRRTDF